jgi:hypothetical protein
MASCPYDLLSSHDLPGKRRANPGRRLIRQVLLGFVSREGREVREAVLVLRVAVLAASREPEMVFTPAGIGFCIEYRPEQFVQIF